MPKALSEVTAEAERERFQPGIPVATCLISSIKKILLIRATARVGLKPTAIAKRAVGVEPLAQGTPTNLHNRAIQGKASRATMLARLGHGHA